MAVPEVNVESSMDREDYEDSDEHVIAATENLYLLLKTPVDFAMEKEYAWLQQVRCKEVFRRLKTTIKLLGRRLYAGNKLDPRLGVTITQPRTETYLLTPRNGGDLVRSTISLLADNVIGCELAFKHPKCPGGMYRGVAQPEVQWKLHQLQDLTNYVARASFQLMEAQTRVKAMVAAKTWDKQIGLVLHAAVRDLRDTLISARNSVVLPKKRTLLELCQFPPTKKFFPPLPPDHCISVYISGPRLVCSVYQKPAPVQGKERDITVVTAEGVVRVIPLILRHLNGALRLIQVFLNNLDAVEPKF